MFNLTKLTLWFLLGTLTALTLIDFGITKAYLGVVGLVGEANPIMRWVAEVFGVNAIAWFKIFFVSLFAICIAFVTGKSQLFAMKGLIALNIVCTCVALYGSLVYISAGLS